MGYHDLAEHVTALVTLLGLFAGISALLLWRMLVRMERKIDELAQHFSLCREELAERFVSRFDYEADRQDLWEALSYHDHDLQGRGVR